ncbi:type II toxin-antitoxin system RelE/ParE family toxin [Catellicoccus marimammalium]|uniref:Type II toxin-antitoxin system RelE/ParE family toxin n=1 Tax=Catellicoccus marimammalium M35/04/3 TaxID=1234409 RepID=K8Z8J4_9ENTE|nr:type II toxin-antitoxin system RelE/ParE family toxin [Catellicoccus marimammalium]EKU27369.1 hypothetical protein C683_0700 [Catellicoccus marimammalium M35/04/3]
MTVYIFQSPTNKIPIQTWLDHVQTKNTSVYHKALVTIQQMEKGELSMKPPQVKKMLARTKHRNLFKMRLGEYRLFFLYQNHNYYLLHAFPKHSQTTPEKEVKQVNKEIKQDSYILWDEIKERYH